MLKSSLCDCSDACILVKGTIRVNKTGTAAAPNNEDQKVTFKNSPPFTNCISEINNTQKGSAKDIDILMQMYNVIEYSDNYSKTSGSLWKYYKDIPAVHENSNIVKFNEANDTDSFNSKAKIIGKTNNNVEINNVEIMVP